jgi:hypothetical protein
MASVPLTIISQNFVGLVAPPGYRHPIPMMAISLGRTLCPLSAYDVLPGALGPAAARVTRTDA